MTRRRRDPEATRTAILEAAEHLFLKSGPAETSTSAIAREAGVTKSLIHHHFGSKDGLWEALKARHFEQYYAAQKEMLEQGEEASGPELLAASIEAYFRFLQQDPRCVKFMSWRFIEDDQTSLGQEEELFALGVARIEESQRAGLLRDDIAPLSMIKAFLAMVQQWFQTKAMLLAMHGPDADPAALDEEYLQDIQRILLDGVKPRREE